MWRRRAHLPFALCFSGTQVGWNKVTLKDYLCILGVEIGFRSKDLLVIEKINWKISIRFFLSTAGILGSVPHSLGNLGTVTYLLSLSFLFSKMGLTCIFCKNRGKYQAGGHCIYAGSQHTNYQLAFVSDSGIQIQ